MFRIGDWSPEILRRWSRSSKKKLRNCQSRYGCRIAILLQGQRRQTEPWVRIKFISATKLYVITTARLIFLYIFHRCALAPNSTARIIQGGFSSMFYQTPRKNVGAMFPSSQRTFKRATQLLGRLELWLFLQPAQLPVFRNKIDSRSIYVFFVTFELIDRLLRNHTQCAVYVLGHCQDATRGVRVFQGAIDTVMDELGCSDINELQSRGGAALMLPSPSLLWFLAVSLFFSTRLPFVGRSLPRTHFVIV